MDPTPASLKALQAAILLDVFPNQGRHREIVEYLFLSFQNPQRRKRIQVHDIIKNCPGESGSEAVDEKSRKNVEQAARKAMSEIKQKLEHYFETGGGAASKWRVRYQAEGDYSLVVLPNEIKNHYAKFWEPYLRHDAVLMYPEPFFVIDEAGTYLRNSRVNRKEEIKEFFSYLSHRNSDGKRAQYVENLRTGHSYIPAGIVRGMALIINSLARHSATGMLNTEAIPPDAAFLRPDGPLIVLATPTSVQETVTILEANLPFRTTIDGIVRNKEAPMDDKEDGAVLEKYGVLTRKSQRGRPVTLIAAKHGKTVEAIAHFLTSEEGAAKLAENMEGRLSFDNAFQALFRVNMIESSAGPNIDETFLEELAPIPTRNLT